MNAEDVKKFLQELKSEIILKIQERFNPSDYYIWLSFNSDLGGDSVAYMEYNPKKKVVKGINDVLIAKLVIFLSRTNNHDLIKTVKEHLE